jgi:hypothetical protein
MSIFEGVMLICFGASWPISILKSIRVKEVTGKSPLFLVIVAIGYVSGIVHKVLFSRDWIIILYIINLIMILTDLALYIHYSRKNREQPAC